MITRQSAAHEARRGQVDSFETKLARATTRHRLGLHIGPHEVALAKFLDATDLAYEQQTVCHFYNLDFTLTDLPVAIEVTTGSGNSRLSASKHERMTRILEQWHVLEIRLIEDRCMHDNVVNQIVSFRQAVQNCDSSEGYKYRLIGSTGKLIVPRGYGQNRTNYVVNLSRFI